MRTVKEFIDVLSQFPPDAEIVVQGQGGAEGCECDPAASWHDYAADGKKRKTVLIHQDDGE